MDIFYSIFSPIIESFSQIKIFGIPFLVFVAISAVALLIVGFLKGGKG